MFNGGIAEKIISGLITALSGGALITAANVWRNQGILLKDIENRATREELKDAMSLRDTHFSAALNSISKDIVSLNTKMDLLLEERSRR